MDFDEFLDLVLLIQDLNPDDTLKILNQLELGIDKSCIMMIYTFYYVNPDTFIETIEEFLNITSIEKGKIPHYLLGVWFANWWPTSNKNQIIKTFRAVIEKEVTLDINSQYLVNAIEASYFSSEVVDYTQSKIHFQRCVTLLNKITFKLRRASEWGLIHMLILNDTMTTLKMPNDAFERLAEVAEVANLKAIDLFVMYNKLRFQEIFKREDAQDQLLKIQELVNSVRIPNLVQFLNDMYAVQIELLIEMGDYDHALKTLNEMFTNYQQIISFKEDEILDLGQKYLEYWGHQFSYYYQAHAQLAFKLGNYENAVHFREIEYRLRKIGGTSLIQFSATTAWYITELCQTGEYSKAKSILDEFNRLRNYDHITVVKWRMSIATATILASDNHFIQQAKAIELLQEVATSEFRNSFIEYKYGMFLLIKLLFNSVVKFDNHHGILEAEKHVSVVEKHAELRNDQPSLIQTSIIRAKVKLLRGDADKAENILNKAIKKADDLGLKTFSDVAREELDGLKNKQLKIQSLGDSLKANALKVKELEISKYLDKAMLMMSKDN